MIKFETKKIELNAFEIQTFLNFKTKQSITIWECLIIIEIVNLEHLDH